MRAAGARSGSSRTSRHPRRWPLSCARAWGAEVSVFRAPLPFLAALRDRSQPTAVVLDWRLEHELSAALFLATRHRYPTLPVIYWTGHSAAALPSMITEDARTTVVDKAGGTEPFERALDWASGVGDEAGRPRRARAPGPRSSRRSRTSSSPRPPPARGGRR